MSLRIDANSEPIPGYRLIERIGGGGFGEVWKAEAPGGLFKAIKIIHGDLRSIDADGSRHAEQELRALKRLQIIRHPYLLSLERYDVVEGRLLIVTELADCNLWDRFREMRAQHKPGIPRAELLNYMEEAAEVLDMMNTQYQLQHLDIKPQNLFLVYNHVKVADFGLVKDLQGMRGQITGGVTPVYAAPETFDSIVSRYCDQYSLAIVYQELLSGVRPFNGTSGQQLLIQHLREPPNLGPLPPADRPVVARALAKKPEDRFPTCLQFIRALQQAGTETPAPRPPATPLSPSRQETPVGTSRVVPPLPPLKPAPMAEPLPPMETPKTQLHFRRDESPAANVATFSISDMALPPMVAPPEVTGEGALLPAVLIGIGQGGLDVLRDFRRMAHDQFGTAGRLPHLKVLFIDTDSDTLHSATTPGPGALEPTEVIPARLNRPAHYLKPRRNGRSLIEGWFDPQALYRIPRNPTTVGLRVLGRLAFLDHYRTFAEKFVAAVEACSHPDALAAADRATRLGLRTNRPRVYVVAGLGGGTGGGMFLDAAYTARHKLRQMGYADAEIVGVFLLPPADRGIKGPALINTYTALRELNHFSQAETVFTVSLEDRDGEVNDSAAPFARCFVLPPNPSAKGEQPQEVQARRAATFLVADLLSPIGKTADEVRGRPSRFSSPEAAVSVFGRAAYVWPKKLLLTRAARWLGAVVLTRWTASDPDVIGEYVKEWLAQRWQGEQLAPEQLVARMQAAGEKILGQPAERLFASDAEQFAARGWFSREPDTAKLWQAMSRLHQLVGMPDERLMQRVVGEVEQKLDEAADVLLRELSPKVARLATTLLEHPDYRLVGAEEVVKQLQGLIDAALAQYEPMSVNLGTQAIDACYTVHEFLSAERGQKRPSATEVADGIRNYPIWRYQSLILRQVCRIYSTFRTQLTDQLRELQLCRQRLEDITNRFRRDMSESLPHSERILLPRGAASADAVSAGLQSSVNSDDLRTFDKLLQSEIEREFNALFNVCVSSISMLGNLQQTIEEQAKAFLAGRLTDSGLGQMFQARFPDAGAAEKALLALYEHASPPLKLFGPERAETVLLVGPDGDAGESIRQVAGRALPTPPANYITSADEVLIYREFAHVPLTALPQLGPLAEGAYKAALESQNSNPHSRLDVPTWQDVEVG
jgi:eukaryotic-like serine/threonine-protein kinase